MDILLSIIIVFILGAAIAKMLNDKKKGSKCSSCPYANVCSISTQSSKNIQCDISKEEQKKLIPKA